ncbi:hypothetical protein ACIQWR_28560 [Streptomyces sp. NPDC098789]|uniref:hypothetical protein n=1 Tax=Streptomyces sp. NPDC098789 TaxID=3366098 RepID=UPI0038137984
MTDPKNAATTAVALINAASRGDQQGIESLLGGLANDSGEADGELIAQLIYSLAYMGAQLGAAATGGDPQKVQTLLGRILVRQAGL